MLMVIGCFIDMGFSSQLINSSSNETFVQNLFKHSQNSNKNLKQDQLSSDHNNDQSPNSSMSIIEAIGQHSGQSQNSSKNIQPAQRENEQKKFITDDHHNFDESILSDVEIAEIQNLIPDEIDFGALVKLFQRRSGKIKTFLCGPPILGSHLSDHHL